MAKALKTQTKAQKKAEQVFRRKELDQRLNRMVSFPDYASCNVSYYLDKWVKQQLVVLEEFLSPGVREKIAGGRILELGAESGHISAFLRNAKLGSSGPRLVVATDISESLIEAMPSMNARLNLAHCPAGAIADNYHLPFKDGVFDLVVGFSVLHHVPDPQPVMQEVERVLEHGGMAVFIGEPFLPWYLLPMQFLFSIFEKKQGICEKVFSLNQWYSAMAGFKIEYVRLFPPEAIKNLTPNSPFLYRYLTGGGLGIVLRKKPVDA